MQYKIISIGPRQLNSRTATVVDAQFPEGKTIECSMSETATDLHLITVKYCGDSIPDTFVKSPKNLDSLQVGDILTMDE